MISRYKKLLLAGTGGLMLGLMPFTTIFAQDSVDTTLIGLDPILDVSCESTANNLIVPGIPITQNTWSCMDPQLTSIAGDIIQINVEAIASDTLLVGGRVQGLESISAVTCENINTQQSVVFEGQGIGWDCVANGLSVTPGDSISLQILGITATQSTPPCGPGVNGLPCEPPPPCDPTGANGIPCEPPLPCDPTGVDGVACEPPLPPCDPAGIDGLPCEPPLPCDPAGVDGIPCEPPVPCDPAGVDGLPCEPPLPPCDPAGVDGLPCEPPLPPCDPAGVDGLPCEPPVPCDPTGANGIPCESPVPCDPLGVDGIPCEPPVPCDPVVGCEPPPPIPCGIDGRLCPEPEPIPAPAP